MSQGKVTADSLSFRTSARVTTSNKIRNLATGTIVDIIRLLKGESYSTGNGSRDDWYEVKVGGETGFVAAAWIQNISVPSRPISGMTEIRGVWLLSHFNSSVLKSSASIKNALDFLEASGFNTLFVAVWNQGFTAFPSDVMKKNGFPQQDPEYVRLAIDPLQEVINQAKGRNFAVFPWFEYGFAVSPREDGGHILTAKPQWSAIDQSGGKVHHGGLTWMNSLDSEVQQFITDLMTEVIDKYDITGVQGCDRLPAMPHLGGYDNGTKSKYRSRFSSNPPTNTKQAAWVKFRADLLTDYLKRLRGAIKAKNPNCVFSISPSPFRFGLDNVLQDSENWLKQGLVDFLCPQWYRTSSSAYANEVNSASWRLTRSQLKQIVPGIAFTANGRNLTSTDVVQCVKHNRAKGLGGQVFFFYEGLTSDSNAIASALKSKADYARVASLPAPPFV
jgi:uncharacterized lipoprotein YddW (UPF0748 family)